MEFKKNQPVPLIQKPMYSTKTETQRCGCRALSSSGYVRNGIPTGCAVSQHHQFHHPATVGCSQRMSMNQTPEHSTRVLTCGRAHTHNSTHCPRPCQAQQRAPVYCNSELKVTETLPVPTVWSQHGSIPSLSQHLQLTDTPPYPAVCPREVMVSSEVTPQITL